MTLINRGLPNFVVPKDDNSWMLIYNGNEMDGSYIVFPIPKSDLRELFKVRLFDNLNAQFGILIDECEEEEISGIENLQELKSIINQYFEQDQLPIVKYYLEKMLYLVDKAIEYNTVIMFYF